MFGIMEYKMEANLLRYEFPTAEKIRTFLRLSNLFTQLEWLASQDNYHCHEAALLKYFNIQDATQRGDQKNDIIQELERNRIALSAYVGNPDVDQTLLNDTLERITRSVTEINAIGLRLSHLSSQNEFLRMMSQRSAIPAGFCEFDIPAYHHWLNLPDSIRKEHLSKWLSPMKAYHRAVALILEVLRNSVTMRKGLVAKQGTFEIPMQGKVFPLVQVFVDPSLDFVPKVSANKYMLSVCFVPSGFNGRVIPRIDVPFELGLCSI